MAVKHLGVALSLALFGLLGAACSQRPFISREHPKPVSSSAESGNTPLDEDRLLRSSFSDCSDKSGGVTAVLQACMEEEYQFQNKRLQTAYVGLLQSQNVLSRRETERLQVEWLARKDKKCAWDAVHGGQAQRLEADYCNMQSTAQRAAELEQRLRQIR